MTVVNEKCDRRVNILASPSLVRRQKNLIQTMDTRIVHDARKSIP